VPLIAPRDEQVPTVSVIVPLHRDGPRFRRCLEVLTSLPTGITYEVFVVTDDGGPTLPETIRHLSTGVRGPTSPAVKRDAGGRVARGEVLAFIDDDAYPQADWLDAAMRVLADPSIHGVGGPGLTPPDSHWRERLGGAVYESPLGSGPLRARFVRGASKDADDLPAYNLFIRRGALEKIGGWSSSFYGGEDTKVCLELTQAGFRLRYDPDVVVFHYRRPVFLAHMRQIGNVGLHRGHFVRRYPTTSRRAAYFIPAVASVVAIPLLFALGRRASRSRVALSAALAAWVALAAPAATKVGISSLLFPAALAAHHLAYGVSFVRGLLVEEITD
jgi:glycosyltransferase involved in cell wall biosynthesis